jgi:diacylglycerol kinase family enzyme
VSGFLVINPRSGAEFPTPSDLAHAAAERGVEAHVLRAGEDAALVAADSGADPIGVAGGDGSLAGVAAVALGRAIWAG